MSVKALVTNGRQTSRKWLMAAVSLALAAYLLYYLEFTDMYFDLGQEMYLGWACFIVIFLLYRLRHTQRHPLRTVFMVLSAFLAMRYLQWRAFDTLTYTGPLDFIGMSLLFLAEVYGMIIYLLGMFVNIWPLESEPIALPPEREKWPTVDVLIPTYNEPDDIVRITAIAATQIDYPKEKLRIYIIDDGGTHAKRNHPETGQAAWERHYRMRRIAEELGVGYLTRETNQQAKAGNINHALRYTDGELVLVLDCDHVPTKDILQNTVGHFIADPKLFLVQTPHFFINPTPVEKNLEGVGNLSAENDMFYRRIHPALNYWNASYFCGSAALLRRSCLAEVGGIRGATITEDAETAFHLHSRGYNSVYINRPMVCGLSPESYDDYVIQRSRWAQGMVQLVMLNNPLKTKGLSLPQRIAYFNSSFFWFFGFPRFIYFIAPASYLIFGLNIYHASWMQILAFTLPYVLSIYVVMDYCYAGSRQPFFSEIYESVQSLFLMPAVISVLLNPRKPSFKVTPKRLTNEKGYLSPLAAPFFLVIAINLAAVIVGGARWLNEPAMQDVIAVTAVWCVYNLYLSLVSLGAFWERKQVRKYYRIGASGAVTAFFPRIRTSHIGEVLDVSVTGTGFEIALPFAPRAGEWVILTVKDSYGREYRFESTLRRAIERRGKYFCGCEFIAGRVSRAEVVSYVFGDSRRWDDNWERKSRATGTYRMLWHFMKTGVRCFAGRSLPLMRQALPQLWKLAVHAAHPAALREKALAAGSWCFYYLSLMVAATVEFLDRRRIRKLQRLQSSGEAVLYVPRLNATLKAQVLDISLSGIAVLIELPFALREQERITIRATYRDGQERQFDCFVRRTIKKGRKTLCGAEFIVDVFSYPDIVKFASGGRLRKLQFMLAPDSGLPAHARAAAFRAAQRVGKAVVAMLAFIFLNPQASVPAALARKRQGGVAQ